MASLSNARAPLARRMAIFVAAGASSALFGAGCSAASTDHDASAPTSGRGNTDSSLGGSGLGAGGVKLNVSNGGAAGGTSQTSPKPCVTTTASAQPEPGAGARHQRFDGLATGLVAADDDPLDECGGHVDGGNVAELDQNGFDEAQACSRTFSNRYRTLRNPGAQPVTGSAMRRIFQAWRQCVGRSPFRASV
jgi:hypothetical protein